MTKVILKLHYCVLLFLLLIICIDAHAQTFPANVGCSAGSFLATGQTTFSRVSSCPSGGITNHTIPSGQSECLAQCSSVYRFRITPKVNSCPANSINQTAGSSTCIPDSGYEGYQLPSGQWATRPIQNQCPVNSTFTNGACQCNANHPIERINASGEISCSNTTPQQDGILMGLSAAALGLSLSAVTGLFAGAAACIASLICAAGLGVVAFGAVLAGTSMTINDTGATQTNANGETMLNVTLPTTRQTTRQPDRVILNPQGSVVPPSNSTANPDGTFTYNHGNGRTSNIDTNNNVITHTRTNGNGEIITTSIKNTPTGATITSISSRPFGTSATGSTVTRQTTSQIQATPQTTANSPPSSTSESYTTDGQTTPQPPQGTIIGTSPNNPAFGNCPDCAKEITQQRNNAELQSINQKLTNNTAVTGEVESFADLTEQDWMDMMIERTPFYDLTEFEPVPSGIQCPTISFSGMSLANINIEGMTMSSHCQIAQDNRENFHIIFNILYTILAFTILLG